MKDTKPKTESTEKKYVPNYTMPRAYIFDIDGTLADKGQRSPYDWYKVGEDEPRDEVVAILHTLAKDHNIIIFTGRDGVCKPETLSWLKYHDIDYQEFHIRPEGNIEKDTIVKKAMFEKVKDKYAIMGVFDDRNQVVEMWRDMGLQCYQVNYGDF